MIILLINLTVRIILPLLILVFATQWVRNYLQKKGGLSKRSFNNHIILLGWNSESQDLINELISLKSDIKIIIIDEMTNNPILDHQLPARNVGFVCGSPFDPKILNQANFTKSIHIFFLVNQKESFYGFPISFNNFYNELILSSKIQNPPKFSVLNTSNKYNDIYNFLHLESSMNSFPKLYYKLIQSLFSGSTGMFTLIEKWLSNIRIDDPFRKLSPGCFLEIPARQDSINSKLAKQLTYSYPSINKMLLSTDSETVCIAYYELSNSLFKDNYRLLGIKTIFLKDSVKYNCMLINPHTQNDIITNPDQFQINELVLYLMRC
jgi:hypothetical protein